MKKEHALTRYFKKLRGPERKKQVVIHVRGGVAYCTRCSRGVNVTIIDHDNDPE